MKATILFGSPRENGNTASLLKPFISELSKYADIKLFDAYKMNVKGCNACLGCQGDINTINCVIDDDMKEVYESVTDSDLIVIASPIYAWSIPGPLKSIIDRLIYSSCKFYSGNPNGPALLKGKKLALLLTCGYPVDKGSDLFIESMKRYSKHCKLEFSGAICERQRNLNEQFMDSQKEANAIQFARELV